MRRREFITGLSAMGIASAQGASAQQRALSKVPIVGVLTPADSDRNRVFEAFHQGLRDHGYTEGRNITLEFRLARGDYASLPRLAAELVRLPADVILTDGDTAVANAAISATKTIPIVMATSADPVGQGLSQAWRAPAATSPASLVSQMSLASNVWSLSEPPSRRLTG